MLDGAPYLLEEAYGKHATPHTICKNRFKKGFVIRGKEPAPKRVE